MSAKVYQHKDAAFEHRLALLAASFTASSPIARPSRTELLDADQAFRIERIPSVVAWLRRIRDAVVWRLRRRAAIAELQGLSDRTLADIGLSRSMIAQAVDDELRREQDRTAAEQARADTVRPFPTKRDAAGDTRRLDQAA